MVRMAAGASGLFVLSRSAAASLDRLLLEHVGDFLFFALHLLVAVRLHHVEFAVRSFDDRELFVVRRDHGIHCVSTAGFNRWVREESVRTVTDQACQGDLQLKF